MKEVFGAGLCRLLIINSRNPEKISEEPIQDIWTSCMPAYDFYKHNIQRQIEQQQLLQQQQLSSPDSTTPSEFAQLIQPKIQNVQIGNYLSKQDLQYVGAMVEELIVNGVVPHMERKIRSINQHVGNTKRGFGSKLKTMFNLGKGRNSETTNVSPYYGDSGVTVGSNRFVFSTPEIQIRRMADYCFMLKDYEIALQTYRLIVNDFKNNKQDWKFYAGVQVFWFVYFFVLMNAVGIHWIVYTIQ